MTKQDTALYADIDKIDVPAGLRKLDQNHVDTIAASAKAKRLYVPVLLKKGKGDRFILEDGQHRLAAMKQNGETRIKYELVEDADAGDIANMVRKQYTFAERIKVVTQRKEDADSVLASALGVTERKVKQLRALSELPQVIIDSVEAGYIDERMAQRATALPPNMLKEMTKALSIGRLPHWARSAEEMADALEKHRIPLHVAIFNIAESGLKYDRDLFDADGGYFQNQKAFLEHQTRAAQEMARTLTSDVKVIPGTGWNEEWAYCSPINNGNNGSSLALLTPGASTTAAGLRKRITELEKKLKTNTKGLGADIRVALDASMMEYSNLIERPDSYDPAKLKDARVLIQIANDGTVQFKIARKQKAAPAPASRSKSSKAEAPKKPFEPHTRSACAIARDHRDLLIQEAMVANHTFGLRVALASMLTAGEFGVRMDRRTIQSKVEDHSKRAKEIPVPKRNESFSVVWQRVCGMDLPQLIIGIAEAAAPFNYHGTDMTEVQGQDKNRLEILRQAIVCVEAPPLPYDYFAAHQTAQLLAILTKVKGKKEADLYAGKPKKQVAAAVQAACLEAGWLPFLLEAMPEAKAAKKPKAKKAPKALGAKKAAPKPKKMAKAA